MLLIKPDDEATQGLADVPAARKYFDEYLPQFSGFISDAALASVIAKPPSRLPVFRFAGPRLHRGASTVVLGDAVGGDRIRAEWGIRSAIAYLAIRRLRWGYLTHGDEDPRASANLALLDATLEGGGALFPG